MADNKLPHIKLNEKYKKLRINTQIKNTTATNTNYTTNNKSTTNQSKSEPIQTISHTNKQTT